MEDASKKLENNTFNARALYLNPYGVLGYIRVSTDEQATHGESLKKQEKRIREYVASNGLDLMGVVKDEASAMPDKTHKRNGFVDLIKGAANHRLAIVVTSIDRLTRCKQDAENIILREIPVHVVDLGRIVKQAELRRGALKAERDGRRIRQATSDAMNGKKANGARLGSPEILKDVRGKGTQANIDRADALALRVAAILARHKGPGRLSHKDLADALNRAGIPTCHGGPWNPGQLRAIRKRAERLLEVARKRPGGLGEILRDHGDIILGRF